MIRKIFSKLLDVNAREISRLEKKAVEINSFEKKASKLKKGDFKKKTVEFKKKLEKGGSLDDILPEAFAVAREASHRAIGLKHYDVQMMSAVALFEGKVVEQKTGEGKTISAVPALYLRALTGKGAHLVTVNDYLARRDAGWNAPVFELLGMSVGVIAQEQKSYIYDRKFSDKSHGDERLEHLKPSTRKESYAMDVTYGTNNEFGFDYLRDNMARNLQEMVQRDHYFAIVDEVDSVLIDEARTPLIISRPDSEPADKYVKFAGLVDKLNSETDYTIDEKSRSASLTERGIQRLEKVLGVKNLYESDFEAVHHVENALRAKAIYFKDKDYVVKDGSVTIVDEFTGRLMFGRRWSDGLHQAVEAKEGVVIQQESKTLATVSFQNYFRMYEYLSGMTGTASTEAEEFRKIYELETVVVPTNKPITRKDEGDLIYKTLRGKYAAIADEIMKKHKKGQPVLVGTTSISKNETISSLLKRRKVPHNVLNAKNHESEASIIAQAGKPGAVTVATNMAGRGVDIVLGGADPGKGAQKKVLEAGGLHVIGTERHDSRRIDNQLRGRSGRQGDAGSSRFYLSLEDDLMRVFGGERIGSMMESLKLPEDQPIENKLISKAIEQAQVKVEGFNFDMRKGVVEYDDVANQHREIIYKLRKRILNGEDLSREVVKKLEDQVEVMDVGNLKVELLEIIPDGKYVDILVGLVGKAKGEEKKRNVIKKGIVEALKIREKQAGEKVMGEMQRFAYLGAIDHMWIEHIDGIDNLRDGVRLRSYGQRDPVVEFKNEAFDMFEGLLAKIDNELARRIFRVGVARPAPEVDLSKIETNVDKSDQMGLASPEAKQGKQTSLVKRSATKKEKIGRNDPCWCGSKKKFKKCHYPQEG